MQFLIAAYLAIIIPAAQVLSSVPGPARLGSVGAFSFETLAAPQCAGGQGGRSQESCRCQSVVGKNGD
jgi:hypothetical protein